ENEFYKTISTIKSGLFDRLIAQGFYNRRPDRVAGKYVGGGIFLLVAGFMASFMFAAATGLVPFPIAILAPVL
ncbi:MAG: DUF2207 domain-containing protein, partial [Akkermansiaceae bacterium]|nr:DUF2207 domain-containing protein [Akkermansiaceae bacterium]